MYWFVIIAFCFRNICWNIVLCQSRGFENSLISVIVVKYFLSQHSLIDFSDADVRLTRRIRRDTIDKGRDIKAVLDQVTKLPLMQFLLCIKSNNI